MVLENIQNTKSELMCLRNTQSPESKLERKSTTCNREYHEVRKRHAAQKPTLQKRSLLREDEYVPNFGCSEECGQPSRILCSVTRKEKNLENVPRINLWQEDHMFKES